MAKKENSAFFIRMNAEKLPNIHIGGIVRLDSGDFKVTQILSINIRRNDKSPEILIAEVKGRCKPK